MAIKKVTAKKATVKKPVMKRGGAKKPLKKAQYGDRVLEGPLPEFAAANLERYAKTYPIPNKKYISPSDDRFSFGKDYSNTLRDPNKSMLLKAENDFYNENKNLYSTDRKAYLKKLSESKPSALAENAKRQAVANNTVRMATKPATPIQKKGGLTSSTKKPLAKTSTGTTKMQKGGSTVQQVKKEKDAILKRQDAITREQDIKAAKSSSDYYKSRVNDLRKVQKVYPTVNKFNELKNEYNKKAVEANKEKVELNASKYKKTGGSTKMKKGGSTGDKKWIQKAINPAHKGYCTPMTKPTCTPKRKALAKTLKAMAKKK